MLHMNAANEKLRMTSNINKPLTIIKQNMQSHSGSRADTLSFRTEQPL